MIISTEFNTNTLKTLGSEQSNIELNLKSNKSSSDFSKVLKKEKSTVLKTEDKNTVPDNEPKTIEKSIEDELKGTTTEELVNSLANIVDILNKFSIEDKLESTEVENINDAITNIISSLMNSSSDENSFNNLPVINNQVLNITSKETLEISKVLNNILSLMETSNVKEVIDTTSISNIQSMLKELGVKISESNNVTRGEVSEIEKLLDELDSKLSNISNLKQENLTDKNNSGVKVDLVREEPNKNLDNNANAELNNKDSNNKQGSELDKKVSKEEKVLSSILGEDNDLKTNRFSMMTERVITSNVESKAETTVVNKGTMVQDVVKNVKYMVNSGVKELIVKINPKELGEMSIRIIQEDGVMKANLKASSKDTYNLLSQNLNDIKKYLGDSNIKIQEVNIALYNEDTTFYKDGEFAENLNQQDKQHDNGKKGRNNTDARVEEETLENEAEDNSNIDMLA